MVFQNAHGSGDTKIQIIVCEECDYFEKKLGDDNDDDTVTNLEHNGTI